MDWSLSKLIRIENGSVGISTNDLKVLLGHYGIVAGDRIEGLIALAKAAKDRSWWRGYSGIAAPKLLQFVEYEAAATITRNFEPLLIPGLLQTEEYAREVIGKVSEQMPKDDLDALVSLRMKRQELLEPSGPPPWFFFILDEGVVRRLVGGQDVMHRQIRHLIELAGAGATRPLRSCRSAPVLTVGCTGRSRSLSFQRQRMKTFCIWRAPEPT